MKLMLVRSHWKVLLLVSVLLLGVPGTSQDVFAANDKLEKIIIGYNGDYPVIVFAVNNHDELLEPAVFTNEFSELEISKSNFDKNKFDSKIFLTSDVIDVDVEIHTSCSKPLFKEQTFDDYVILDLLTENGNTFQTLML